MTNTKDTLYAAATDSVSGFRFDDQVVAVFPDMIQRSVPGYATIIHMIGQIAKRYVPSDTNVYDLGCSLGAATLAMRHQIAANNVNIIAVDNSQSMIEKAEHIIKADAAPVPVSLHCADLREITMANNAMSVLNFVLQFLPIEERCQLLRKIADSMLPGGVLILSEKIRFEETVHNDLMTDLHHHFKKSNGYSDLEIAQKRTALENVLIPETLQAHIDRLKTAGFRSVECWFQCFNFVSLIAFK